MKSIHSQITCRYEKFSSSRSHIHEYIRFVTPLISESNVVEEIKNLNSNSDGDCLYRPSEAKRLLVLRLISVLLLSDMTRLSLKCYALISDLIQIKLVADR